MAYSFFVGGEDLRALLQRHGGVADGEAVELGMARLSLPDDVGVPVFLWFCL